MSKSTHLPEITLKAVILTVILAVILAAANAYLGLKVGMTISASIPAVAISIGVLGLFRKSNVLESNIVQTGASAGEALVAGIIFILPALLIIRFWNHFNYLETTLVAMIGGILGVLFSIPLRRILLADKTLPFPEGTAIGQVLKVSVENKAELNKLVKGGFIGAAISFMQTGLQVISESSSYWFNANHTFVYGLNLGFEPALLAAGYIVGIRVAMSTLVGVLVSWVAGIPILSYVTGEANSTQNAATIAMHLWETHVRYIGVGTMLVGGVWMLITLIKPVIQGLRSSIESMRIMQTQGYQALPRIEQDIPIHYAFALLIILLIPLSILFHHFINQMHWQVSFALQIMTLILSVILTVVSGFIFASLCGYFAGLVGSSNNPLSGLSMSALLMNALVLYFMFFLFHISFVQEIEKLSIAAFIIFLTTVMISAAAITNDTIQDLKAGQIIGATPWKQQVMLIIGTIISALVIPLILQLLFNAYGIGNTFPHADMNPAQALAAPQATLMATLAQGVFSHQLPWMMLTTGGYIAIACIIADFFLRKKNKNLSVLAVGLGIYLPMSVSLPLIFGSLLSYCVQKTLNNRYFKKSEEYNRRLHRGLVACCGIVAGASLMGVILAIPFTLAKSTDVLKILPGQYTDVADCLGIISTIWILRWIYNKVCKKQSDF